MRKVMVFGVFDGVHEGHRHFLREAKALGDYLIAVLAQNHVVEHLKGRAPQLDMADRFDHLREEDGVDEVVIGDAEVSTWEVVRKHRPEVVAVGYDQTLLHEDLEKHRKEFDWPLELHVLSAYEPNIYHSSMLQKEDENEGEPE
jgi:FAD synthetase